MQIESCGRRDPDRTGSQMAEGTSPDTLGLGARVLLPGVSPLPTERQVEDLAISLAQRLKERFLSTNGILV